MGNAKIFIVICFFSSLFYSCGYNSINIKPIINKKYTCDSVSVETLEFYKINNKVFNRVKNEPFEFKFEIASSYKIFNKKKFYYLIGGGDSDTIGFVNIRPKLIILRDLINRNRDTLFNFNISNRSKWKIKNQSSLLNNYVVTFKKKYFRKKFNDIIYHYNFEYVGIKFPNGYYFKSFNVSKKNGIISFNFDNGIKCKEVDNGTD